MPPPPSQCQFNSTNPHPISHTNDNRHTLLRRDGVLREPRDHQRRRHAHAREGRPERPARAIIGAARLLHLGRRRLRRVPNPTPARAPPRPQPRPPEERRPPTPPACAVRPRGDLLLHPSGLSVLLLLLLLLAACVVVVLDVSPAVVRGARSVRRRPCYFTAPD